MRSPGSMDTLIGLGVSRVLTSGGRPSHLEGVETLAALVERAHRAAHRHGRRPARRGQPTSRYPRGQSQRSASRVGCQCDGPWCVASAPRDRSEIAWQCVDVRHIAGIVGLVRAFERVVASSISR